MEPRTSQLRRNTAEEARKSRKSPRMGGTAFFRITFPDLSHFIRVPSRDSRAKSRSGLTGRKLLPSTCQLASASLWPGLAVEGGGQVVLSRRRQVLLQREFSLYTALKDGQGLVQCGIVHSQAVFGGVMAGPGRPFDVAHEALFSGAEDALLSPHFSPDFLHKLLGSIAPWPRQLFLSALKPHIRSSEGHFGARSPLGSRRRIAAWAELRVPHLLEAKPTDSRPKELELLRHCTESKGRQRLRPTVSARPRHSVFSALLTQTFLWLRVLSAVDWDVASTLCAALEHCTRPDPHTERTLGKGVSPGAQVFSSAGGV